MMTPERAASVIQRAWFAHKMASSSSQYDDDDDDFDWYELYPDRPVDYTGMMQVITRCNDMYY